MTFLLGRQLANKETVMGSSSESRGKLTWILVDICPALGEMHVGKKSIVQTLRTAGAGLLLILIIKQLRFHPQILRESPCQSRCKALSLWIQEESCSCAGHLCLDKGHYFRKYIPHNRCNNHSGGLRTHPCTHRDTPTPTERQILQSPIREWGNFLTECPKGHKI